MDRPDSEKRIANPERSPAEQRHFNEVRREDGAYRSPEPPFSSVARPQNLDGSQQSGAHGKWAPHRVAMLVYGLAAFILLTGAPGAAILSVTMFPATALWMDEISATVRISSNTARATS